MKYLLLLILVGPPTIFAATETPGSARDAVTKALTSESWTLDQTKLRDHLIVLDHPTLRRQITMSQESILFIDYAANEQTRTTGILHPLFFETTFASFGVTPTPITPALDSWVE